MEVNSMRYSVDIDRSIDALVNCLRRVQNGIDGIYGWHISINASGTDCGIYFNFDLENEELEISNAPDYEADDSLSLDEIIDEINEEYGEDDE